MKQDAIRGVLLPVPTGVAALYRGADTRRAGNSSSGPPGTAPSDGETTPRFGAALSLSIPNFSTWFYEVLLAFFAAWYILSSMNPGLIIIVAGIILLVIGLTAQSGQQ